MTDLTLQSYTSQFKSAVAAEKDWWLGIELFAKFCDEHGLPPDEINQLFLRLNDEGVL